MDVKLIEKKIFLEPEYLNKEYKINLLNKLRIVTKNECSQTHGFIINVNKIIKIVDKDISTTNSCPIFTVIFEANVIHPQKDKIYEGSVCMISSLGIFININDVFKALIPISELSEYTFDSSENSFKKDKKKIKVGDMLKFCIKDLKYSNKKFSCFGKLI